MDVPAGEALRHHPQAGRAPVRAFDRSIDRKGSERALRRRWVRSLDMVWIHVCTCVCTCSLAYPGPTCTKAAAIDEREAAATRRRLPLALRMAFRRDECERRPCGGMGWGVSA